MTYPEASTPDQSVHTVPGASTTQNTPAGSQLDAFGENLQVGILTPVVQSVTGAVTTGSSSSDLQGTLSDWSTGVATDIGTAQTTADNAPTVAVGDVANAVASGAGDVVSPTGTVSTSAGGADAITTYVASTNALLGNPTVQVVAGSSPSADSTNLETLLGLLGTGSAVPVNLLSALAPGSSANVLPDPDFSNMASLQGQGLWLWDTPGQGGTAGCIRTKRPGTITVYYVVGSFDYLSGEPFTALPDPPTLIGTYVSPYLDTVHLDWVTVPYPGNAGWNLAQGVKNLAGLINSIPGKFVLIGGGTGAQVISGVYDALRAGTLSLQGRLPDLLMGLAISNPRREENAGWPGGPLYASNSSGASVPNLQSTDGFWWEWSLAAGTYPANNELGGVTYQVSDPLSCCPTNNIGAAVQQLTTLAFANPAMSLHQLIDTFYAGGTPNQVVVDEFTSIYNIYTGTTDPLSTPVDISSWSTVQPWLAAGDERTFQQIAFAAMNNLAYTVSPPLEGVRHQMLGIETSVQPEEVLTASVYVAWVDVVCPGPAITLALNAYDASGNLIGGEPVTAEQAIISDPATNSDGWQLISSAFVTPPGAVTACLLFDVEAQAVATGTVWFSKPTLEVSGLIDSALLGNIANIPQLSAESVSGPQGIADMLTGIQNLIDNLASANSQASLSGVQLSDLFASAAQTALNAATALSLGVNATQVLNPSNTPIYNGLQPSGEVTFPLTSFTAGSSLPFAEVNEGTSIFGFIRCAQAVSKGFIEFMAEGTGGSGVYVNVYQVNPSTGAMTSLWSSSDISSSIPNGSWGWVAITIPTDDEITVTAGELVALEVVAAGSNFNIAAETLGIPNNAGTVPPNVGATRTLSSTGGNSPASLTEAQLGFGGTAPFICFGISDLPPSYILPAQTTYAANGLYTYPIPGWAQTAGAQFDVAALPGGGGGGPVSGALTGQGGSPGSWATQTFTYGTDIPDNVTTLAAIVGVGGAPGAAGGSTLVGYGLVTPTFDAVGVGATGHGANQTLSWAHTITGDAIIVAVSLDVSGPAPAVSAQVGGVQMTPLAQTPVYFTAAGGSPFAPTTFYCSVLLFGLLNPPTGPQTITFTSTGTSYLAGNSVSYNNVSSFGSTITNTGTGTSATITVPSAANELVVQAFSNSASGAFSGYNQNSRYSKAFVNQANLAFLLGDAPGSSSVTGTAMEPSAHFGAAAVVLNPALNVTLLSTLGGPGGGAGNNFNPANMNTGSTGLAPSPKTFNGKFYPAGSPVAVGQTGNPAGGAGGGGTTKSPTGAPGANGGAWITAYQSASSAGGVIGGGGGGSELSIVYEATGSGGFNSNSNSLSWTHTSAGGPTCAVVLICTVDYYNGSVTVGCNYGGTSFVYVLDDIGYYNSGGYGLFHLAFGLIGPASGTQSVTVSATGTASVVKLAGNTVSYQNVGSFGNFYTGAGHGTALSLSSIPSTTGQLVVAGFSGLGHDLNSFNQTERWAQTNLAGIPTVIGDVTGASSVSFTATTSATDYWGSVGGVLIPAS